MDSLTPACFAIDRTRCDTAPRVRNPPPLRDRKAKTRLPVREERAQRPLVDGAELPRVDDLLEHVQDRVVFLRGPLALAGEDLLLVQLSEPVPIELAGLLMPPVVQVALQVGAQDL